MHYETKQIELINACQTKADFERALYDLSDGRLSRNECKMLVGRAAKIVRNEKQADKSESNRVCEIAGNWLINIAGKTR